MVGLCRTPLVISAYHAKMAPNLARSQHELIYDMIASKSLSTVQMAEVARCTPRSIKAIRSNIHYFGSTRAPPNGGGRPRSIIPPMLDALRDRLLDKPVANHNNIAPQRPGDQEHPGNSERKPSFASL